MGDKRIMGIMLPVVELIRLEENSDFGTLGILKVNKEIFCCTLEPNDMENTPYISSIPAQQYTCKRYSSSKYPNTFQIMDVPNRSKILFHPGNKIKDTAGCILLGKMFYDLAYDRGIANSGATFNRFISTMEPYSEFHLTIHEFY